MQPPLGLVTLHRITIRLRVLKLLLILVMKPNRGKLGDYNYMALDQLEVSVGRVRELSLELPLAYSITMPYMRMR
jgi:hypothetical protein